MEWRIIVPLLCLIGILHVPGNAAQTNGTNSTFDIVFHIDLEFKSNYINMNDSDTIYLKNNIINQVMPVYRGFKNFYGFEILTFRNGSIVVEGKLYFNSSDAKPIVANLTQLLHDTNFTFTLLKNFTTITEVTPAAVSPNASATASPAKTAVALSFKINQDFKDIYSNLSAPETQELSNNITNAIFSIYKGFPKFLGVVIKKFSPGSIVVDSELQFEATNGTSANLTEVKKALIDAAQNNSLSISVDASSISVTEVSPSNGTATTTPSTIWTTNTTVSTPTKTAQINVVFKMNQTFNETYSNISHPDTMQLSSSIVKAVSPFYVKKFLLFRRMWIRSLSQGSIVVDSVFEFDASNGTSPNLTEVKNTLIDAVQNGNLTLPIDVTSINVTDISSNGTTTTTTTTTSAATTLASSVIAEYNITFKIRDTFTSELANISSPTAKALEKNISDQCGVAYKYLRGFIRMLARKYSNGSIVVDGALQFNKTISSPSVQDLAKVLADNVRNGTVTLQIDPTSIKVTDANGITANKSPVLASMLTAFWMTLASLLLSAVMH